MMFLTCRSGLRSTLGSWGGEGSRPRKRRNTIRQEARKALEKLLPQKPSMKALAKMADDRILAEMSRKSAENQLVEDVAIVNSQV